MTYNSSVIGDITALNKFEFNNEYILNNFQKKLEEKKLEEIVRGQSVIGPHRDDISYYINGSEAKKFAFNLETIVFFLTLLRVRIFGN